VNHASRLELLDSDGRRRRILARGLAARLAAGRGDRDDRQQRQDGGFHWLTSVQLDIVSSLREPAALVRAWQEKRSLASAYTTPSYSGSVEVSLEMTLPY